MLPQLPLNQGNLPPQPTRCATDSHAYSAIPPHSQHADHSRLHLSPALSFDLLECLATGKFSHISHFSLAKNVVYLASLGLIPYSNCLNGLYSFPPSYNEETCSWLAQIGSISQFQRKVDTVDSQIGQLLQQSLFPNPLFFVNLA